MLLQSKRDEGLSKTLRPLDFQDFVGQVQAVRLLKAMRDGAEAKGEPLPHILLHGPAGLGKTTIARILAHDRSLKTLIGSSVRDAVVMEFYLAALPMGGFIFIDEVHRAKPACLEVLYGPMEDYIVAGRPKLFTLLAATTDFGILPAPFRDRFGHVFFLDYYSAEEICTILRRSVGILGITATDDQLDEIACRSRGVPRVANKLLKRISDFGMSFTKESMDTAWESLGVDSYGLDLLDRRVLSSCYTLFGDRPVGVSTLAQALGIDDRTIKNSVEPWLIRSGMLEITKAGRRLTTLSRGLAAAGRLQEARNEVER